MSDVSI